VLSLLLGGCRVLAAAEPVPPPWTWKVRLGVFVQNVASSGAEESRDPTIASSADSTSYTIKGEFQPVWEHDGHRLEQRLETEYGQLRTDDGQGWVENADRLAYGITYERSLGRPYLLYGNGSALTVYTGAEPDSEAFDPFIAKLSLGWGLRQTGLLPIEDALICRIGWFVSKRWEHDAPWYQTEARTGPELQFRYERRQSDDVSYFIQQDAFGDATDIGHGVLISQAGLRVAVAKRISIEFGIRAYYESEPEEAAGTGLGYDTWSVRQEALIGLVWEEASLQPGP
jgi:hypothetical protein